MLLVCVSVSICSSVFFSDASSSSSVRLFVISRFTLWFICRVDHINGRSIPATAGCIRHFRRSAAKHGACCMFCCKVGQFGSVFSACVLAGLSWHACIFVEPCVRTGSKQAGARHGAGTMHACGAVLQIAGNCQTYSDRTRRANRPSRPRFVRSFAVVCSSVSRCCCCCLMPRMRAGTAKYAIITRPNRCRALSLPVPGVLPGRYPRNCGAVSRFVHNDY